jgi:uncharacterized caspase-like protein
MWLALAVVAHAATVRHAVVVGANDGGGVLEPLQYAERDAETVASLLVELGGFDESLVTVLYAPAREDLRVALAKHAAVAAEYDDDLFVFYYSGHADGNGLRLGQDDYWFEMLKHDLRAVDSDVRIGILDACRSGAITRFKGAGVAPSMFAAEGEVAEGEAWLTASSADEVAQESDELRSGFFTHYLLSGMRGAADSGDGVVDLAELHLLGGEPPAARLTGAQMGGHRVVVLVAQLAEAVALQQQRRCMGAGVHAGQGRVHETSFRMRGARFWARSRNPAMRLRTAAPVTPSSCPASSCVMPSMKW